MKRCRIFMIKIANCQSQSQCAMPDQDFNLFAQETADVVPLKTNTRVCLKNNARSTPGQQYRRFAAQHCAEQPNCRLSLVLTKHLKAGDWLSFKRNGIQSGVFRNLRLGKYPTEATLHLHQQTPDQARDELIDFIKASLDCNIRSVLISCGGKNPNALLIKSYLAQWLPELEEIQAFHTAQTHHGGNKAVYVLLRKSEQQKQQNRERHAARLGG